MAAYPSAMNTRNILRSRNLLLTYVVTQHDVNDDDDDADDDADDDDDDAVDDLKLLLLLLSWWFTPSPWFSIIIHCTMAQVEKKKTAMKDAYERITESLIQGQCKQVNGEWRHDFRLFSKKKSKRKNTMMMMTAQ
jgi:hypothetical protein